MARVRAHGNTIVVSGRGADEFIKQMLSYPGLSHEKSRRKLTAMKFPEYSEKGRERLRELGRPFSLVD